MDEMEGHGEGPCFCRVERRKMWLANRAAARRAVKGRALVRKSPYGYWTVMYPGKPIAVTHPSHADAVKVAHDTMMWHALQAKRLHRRVEEAQAAKANLGPPGRQRIRERDGTGCHFCANTLEIIDETLDHVVPKTYGGPNDDDNLVLACRRCNARKGSSIGYCQCDFCLNAEKRFLFVTHHLAHIVGVARMNGEQLRRTAPVPQPWLNGSSADCSAHA